MYYEDWYLGLKQGFKHVHMDWQSRLFHASHITTRGSILWYLITMYYKHKVNLETLYTLKRIKNATSKRWNLKFFFNKIMTLTFIYKATYITWLSSVFSFLSIFYLWFVTSRCVIFIMNKGPYEIKCAGWSTFKHVHCRCLLVENDNNTKFLFCRKVCIWRKWDVVNQSVDVCFCR